VFVFAIVGLFKQANGREPFVKLIVQFLEWYIQLTRRNLSKYHTKDTLKETDKLGIKYAFFPCLRWFRCYVMQLGDCNNSPLLHKFA
jgi:hypothetical protein